MFPCCIAVLEAGTTGLTHQSADVIKVFGSENLEIALSASFLWMAEAHLFTCGLEPGIL